jgi:hypothetical protein
MDDDSENSGYSQYPSGWSEDPEEIPDLDELAVVPTFPSWYEDLTIPGPSK